MRICVQGENIYIMELIIEMSNHTKNAIQFANNKYGKVCVKCDEFKLNEEMIKKVVWFEETETTKLEYSDTCHVCWDRDVPLFIHP